MAILRKSRRLKLVGRFIVICILLIVISNTIASIRNMTPILYKSYPKVESSNKFDSEINRGNSTFYYDYDNKYMKLARRVYDELGIQCYLVSLEYSENFKSIDDNIKYVKDYIVEKDFWKDNAIYLVTSSRVYEDDTVDEDYIYNVNIYNEIIYGDSVNEYLDSDLLDVFSHTYNRYQNNLYTYYDSGLCFLEGMNSVVDRAMHPIKSILGEIYKFVILISTFVILILIIKHIIDERIKKKILETPIEVLHEEAVDDLLDKYQ